MATILPVDGKSPRFGNNCFLAPTHTVGEMSKWEIIAAFCSFNAVVQATSMQHPSPGEKGQYPGWSRIHGTYQKQGSLSVSVQKFFLPAPTQVKHGCTIQDSVLVGMGAISWNMPTSANQFDYCRRRRLCGGNPPKGGTGHHLRGLPRQKDKVNLPPNQ